MRKLLLLLLFLGCISQVFAALPTSAGKPVFIANKGQWPEQVLFSTELPQGWLFLEKDGFTYSFLESSCFAEEAGGEAVARMSALARAHAFRVRFVNANVQPVISTHEKLPGYHNYLIGNDPGKWATEVGLYNEIRYSQLFPGADLRVYGAGNGLKYDYELAPHAAVAAIRMVYEGVDQLRLQNGRLHVKTSLNEVIEEKPYAYQLINGKKIEVACAYTLTGNLVGFEITGSYNTAFPLVIDPELLFITYSGSAGGLSANCATADTAGNTFIASQTMNAQYPVTSGAYQINRRGYNTGISKLNENGTRLIYATYLGGSGGNEYPLSMEVNKSDELVLLGHTNSRDFPVSAQAYNNTYNGGQTDYFVAKLSANGTTLVASTYLGGSQLEGGSIGATPGRLALDALDNIYVGGCTVSPDFPIVNGFQRNYRGSYDGIVCKLNSSLTSLLWSTYLGGNRDELVYDIKIGPTGKVYVAGSTDSDNFPATNGSLFSSQQGNRDGFIAILSPDGTQLQSATYLGTSANDMVKYVDMDDRGFVFAAGYTSGSYPITEGTYGTAGGTGGYFIHKLDPSLSATVFSTHLGTNSGDRAPTAFRVQGCHNIYLAGYGLTSVPLSADAHERTRKTMYVCHLSGDGKQLIYGSYLGGTNTQTHVHHANTSLITKQGVLHQIECTYSKDHPITVGAIKTIHNGASDAAVYKFKFSPVLIDDIISEVPTPAASCAPYVVQFINNTQNGLSYTWNFGDGTPESSAEAPVHTFLSPGSFRVRMIAFNPETCKMSDTVIVTVAVTPPPMQSLPEEVAYSCSGPITLDAGNPGYSYRWSTGATTQTIEVSETGVYEVEARFGDCSITQRVNVYDPLPPVDAPNIITPNGDGKNDYFRINNGGANLKLKIFNRWGKLVYQSDNYQNDWDGSNITQGTYYYLVESPDNCSTSTGWVQVVR